jgi:hypothetical protein
VCIQWAASGTPSRKNVVLPSDSLGPLDDCNLSGQLAILEKGVLVKARKPVSYKVQGGNSAFKNG